MYDRIPTKPGRVKITPEGGQPPYYAVMEMADDPSVVGTPLNKATLLSDATAALVGLGADAIPDTMFSKLKSLIDSANANANKRLQIQTGSYVGTGAEFLVLSFDISVQFAHIFSETSTTRSTNHSIGLYLSPYMGNNFPGDYYYSGLYAGGPVVCRVQFSNYNRTVTIATEYDRIPNVSGLTYHYYVLG